MNTILKDYKRLILECDITHQDFKYDEMDLCWYESTETRENILYRYYDAFKLVSHEAQTILPRILTDSENNNWSLTIVTLRNIYEVMGNPMVLLSSFLCPDYNEKGKLVKEIVGIESYQRVLRRLTIKYFEDIKDELNNAKNTDNFFDFKEEELLCGHLIKDFRDEVLKLNDNGTNTYKMKRKAK